MSGPAVTAELARFAADTTWRGLPDRVRTLLPVLLVDLFRAGTVGYGKPWTRKVRELYTATGGDTASVLFCDLRADAQRAAFANGTACGSLDWDDSHVAAIIHPGIVVWPAALAVAQQVKANGAELLAAVAAGYEVAIRVGMAIQPEHSLRGFQGTPTCGVFGAAAASARLLRLDPQRTRDALGIAATFSCGLAQFFVSGSDIKRFHAGKAAENGIEAALLAHSGLTGPHDAIEGAQGFARAYSDRFNPATALASLGTDYRILDVSLKPHAVSVRMQAAIEAATALALSGVRVEEIDAMEIGVHGAMMGKMTGNAPADLQQAQLSTPFAAALGLTLATGRGADFALSVDDFEEHLAHPAVRALTARTQCVTDAEVERRTTREAVPGRVTVKLKDGSRRDHFVECPKGSPANPLTQDDVCARFRAVAGARLDPSGIEPWLDAALHAADLPELAPLFLLRSLSAGEPSPF